MNVDKAQVVGADDVDSQLGDPLHLADRDILWVHLVAPMGCSLLGVSRLDPFRGGAHRQCRAEAFELRQGFHHDYLTLRNEVGKGEEQLLEVMRPKITLLTTNVNILSKTQNNKVSITV